MQVNSRWTKNTAAEAIRVTVKLPFERGVRRAALRARLLPREGSGRTLARA